MEYLKGIPKWAIFTKGLVEFVCGLGMIWLTRINQLNKWLGLILALILVWFAIKDMQEGVSDGDQ